MVDPYRRNFFRVSWKLSLSTFLIAIIFLTGCGGSDKNELTYPSPKGYNLNKPSVFKLPSQLDEISGISFYPKDKSVFAIHDERGWLYKIYLGEKVRVEKWKYTRGADFEDITLLNDTFYSLKSNGNITAFHFIRPDTLSEKTYHMPGGKKEFESLYFDSSRKQMIMICKDCESDKKNTSGAYAFDLTQMKYVDSPVFIIDAAGIEKKLEGKMPKFKPSGAALHPITGDLYIISSVNKILVIANVDGKVEDVFPLDPKLFKQPEGITFTPTGDLLISNESADIGAPNILVFRYNKSSDQ